MALDIVLHAFGLAAFCYMHLTVPAEAKRADASACLDSLEGPLPMTSVKFPTQLFPEYDWMSAPTQLQQQRGCHRKLKWYLAPSQCAQADEVPAGTSVSVKGLPAVIRVASAGGKRVSGPNGQSAVVQHPGIINEFGSLRHRYPVRLVEAEDCRDCVIYLKRENFEEIPHACCPLPGGSEPHSPELCAQWLRCDSYRKFLRDGNENTRLAWSLPSIDNTSGADMDVMSGSRHGKRTRSGSREAVTAFNPFFMSGDGQTAQHVHKLNMEIDEIVESQANTSLERNTSVARSLTSTGEGSGIHEQHRGVEGGIKDIEHASTPALTGFHSVPWVDWAVHPHSVEGRRPHALELEFGNGATIHSPQRTHWELPAKSPRVREDSRSWEDFELQEESRVQDHVEGEARPRVLVSKSPRVQEDSVHQIDEYVEAHTSNMTAQHRKVTFEHDAARIGAHFEGNKLRLEGRQVGGKDVNMSARVYHVVGENVEEEKELIKQIMSKREFLITHASTGICGLLNVGSYGCRLHNEQCQCSYLAKQSCKTWFENEEEIRPVSVTYGIVLLPGDRCDCLTLIEGGQRKHVCIFGLQTEFPTIRTSTGEVVSS